MAAGFSGVFNINIRVSVVAYISVTFDIDNKLWMTMTHHLFLQEVYDSLVYLIYQSHPQRIYYPYIHIYVYFMYIVGQQTHAE